MAKRPIIVLVCDKSEAGYWLNFVDGGEWTVPDSGKIKGRKLGELFESLIVAKTIISVYVVGADFQRLTCITAVEQTKEGQWLIVDCPDGFSQAAQKSESLTLRFNFNGSDHLEYLFKTSGGALHRRELKVPFPHFVERIQRRKNFRIDTLPGTRLFFSFPKVEGYIDLINISLGGAFGVLVKHNQKNLKGSLFKSNQRLYRISIVFPGDNEIEAQTVHIRKAEIIRVERDRERKKYRYAFEFKDIQKKELQGLTKSIYHIQRRFLQKR